MIDKNTKIKLRMFIEIKLRQFLVMALFEKLVRIIQKKLPLSYIFITTNQQRKEE